MKYRKKPVEIEAIQWNGVNHLDLNKFAGLKFAVIPEVDRDLCGDPEATAQIFDALHSTWVLVYTGDYIIKGVEGEFYPCRPWIFDQTYERGPWKL